MNIERMREIKKKFIKEHGSFGGVGLGKDCLVVNFETKEQCDHFMVIVYEGLPITRKVTGKIVAF